MIRNYIILLAAVCCLTACVKDKPAPSGPVNPPSVGRSVLIANEGSLSNGNASLSVYNIDKDSLYNDVYFTKNNTALGDVFQSIFADGELLYLAINNSDRITVVNKNDYSFVKNIAVDKPRYMAKASDNKLYVTSIFHNKINIVDINTGAVSGSITTDYPNTEGVINYSGKIYACNWDTACNYIYEIDPATDAITHRIPLAGYAPQQIEIDKNGMLWVLSGNVVRGKIATLTQIDPTSRSITKSFSFPAGADVMKPVWNPAKDTLYYLGVNYSGGTEYNGVYRIGISAESLPVAPLIAASTFQYFWGLGLDSVTNTIYLGDPKGFIQKGNVSLYNTSGIKLKSFETGVGPGFFHFMK